MDLKEDVHVVWAGLQIDVCQPHITHVRVLPLLLSEGCILVLLGTKDVAYMDSFRTEVEQWFENHFK